MAEMKAELMAEKCERRETVQVVDEPVDKSRNKPDITSKTTPDEPEAKLGADDQSNDVNYHVTNNRRKRERLREQTKTRKPEVKSNGTLLTKTAVELTAEQKARQELYSRYLYN